MSLVIPGILAVRHRQTPAEVAGVLRARLQLMEADGLAVAANGLADDVARVMAYVDLCVTYEEQQRAASLKAAADLADLEHHHHAEVLPSSPKSPNSPGRKSPAVDSVMALRGQRASAGRQSI